MHENDKLWNYDKEASWGAPIVLVLFYFLNRKKNSEANMSCESSLPTSAYSRSSCLTSVVQASYLLPTRKFLQPYIQSLSYGCYSIKQTSRYMGVIIFFTPVYMHKEKISAANKWVCITDIVYGFQQGLQKKPHKTEEAHSWRPCGQVRENAYATTSAVQMDFQSDMQSLLICFTTSFQAKGQLSRSAQGFSFGAVLASFSCQLLHEDRIL